MKSFLNLIYLIIIYSCVTKANAQYNLAIYIGYGKSEFELQYKAMSAVPLGFTASYCIIPKFEAGIEYCTLIKAFEEKEVLTFDYYGELVKIEGSTYRITQNNIGIFARYYVQISNFCPYIKAGVAYYTGKHEFLDEIVGRENEREFKGTIGYSPAIGVRTSFGLYLEFMYHVVNRKLDYEDANTYRYNNYMIVIGYRYSIKI